MPGSFSSSEAEAVLMLIVPDAPPPPDFPGAVRAPEAASPPGWGAGSGRTSPMRGTRICSPSVRTRARLSCWVSASALAPPTALMASVTRLPGGRVTTPGLLTAPVTWTTTLPDVVLKPPGPAAGPMVGTVAGFMAGLAAAPVGGGRIGADAPAAAVGAAWPPAPVETSTALRARARARMRRAEPAARSRGDVAGAPAPRGRLSRPDAQGRPGTCARRSVWLPCPRR